MFEKFVKYQKYDKFAVNVYSIDSLSRSLFRLFYVPNKSRENLTFVMINFKCLNDWKTTMHNVEEFYYTIKIRRNWAFTLFTFCLHETKKNICIYIYIEKIEITLTDGKKQISCLDIELLSNQMYQDSRCFLWELWELSDEGKTFVYAGDLLPKGNEGSHESFLILSIFVLLSRILITIWSTVWVWP